jgi:pimeloyl-ACP methyl ester carboxylesterase
MFNINNLEALRDNVRESAAEYALFAHVLAGLTLDVSDCPGTTGPAHFDATRMALMGHSMGSTIAPLVLAAEPMYRAVVLSGAGASWIENIIWKQLPTPIRPFVNLELRYNQLDPPMDVQEDDPVVSLFQWAAEPADPLVYTRQLIREPAPGQSPRQVLMEQGIVDHYIMPPIANATSLSTSRGRRSTRRAPSSPPTARRPSRAFSPSPGATRLLSRSRATRRPASRAWSCSTPPTGSRTGTRWCSRRTRRSASTGAFSRRGSRARRRSSRCPGTSTAPASRLAP